MTPRSPEVCLHSLHVMLAAERLVFSLRHTGVLLGRLILSWKKASASPALFPIHLQHLVMNCFLSCFSSPQEERTGLFPLRLLSNQFFTKAINNVPVAVLTTFTPMDEKGLPLSTYIIEFPCPDSSFPLSFHCATFQIHRKGRKK